MSAVSSTQTERTNLELQLFFPNAERFPNELAVIVLENFEAINLSKMQRVSRTWHVVIQRFFHEKILAAKLSYIYEVFQKIMQQWHNPIDNEKINRLTATIPPEKLSIFANLRDSHNFTPLHEAVLSRNSKLINLLVRSIAEKKREAYINSESDNKKSAWSIAKDIFLSGDDTAFNTLKPYMVSLVFRGCMISS